MGEVLYQAIIDFHFVRPLWFIALLPLIALLLLLWRTNTEQGHWQKVIASNLLPYLLVGKDTKPTRLPIILLAVTWSLAVIALSGPVWRQLPQTIEKRVDVQILILDLSQSMNATDTAPSRIARAKHKLSDILNRRHEGLTSLIVFAGSSHVVIPLTDDIKTIAAIIPSLNPGIMPLQGSNPVAAIESAEAMLERGGYTKAEIIMMTDGLKESDIEKMIDALGDKEITLSILGIGTTQGSPIPTPNGSFLKDRSGAIVIPKLNHELLQKAANQLGGRYAEITPDDSDIDFLASSSLKLNNKTEQSTRRFDIWQEDGYWLIALILPFASLAFRRGWLNCILLSLSIGATLPSKSAQAGIWEDLWQTRDQQGAKALQNNQIKDASNLFNSPGWKATAQYKSGQFDKAAEGFSNSKSSHINPAELNPAELSPADNHYNRANSLANMGKYEEAISAYNKALELQPKHEDAQFNRKLLEDLQQQENQSGGDADKQQDDAEKNQDKQDQNQNQNDQNQNNPSRQQSQDEQNQSEQNQSQKGNPKQDKQNHDSEKQQSQQSEKSDQEKSEELAKQEKKSDHSKQDESTPEKPGRQEPAPKELTPEELTPEEQQALQQWLKQIEDDPGGLLRNKFYLQARELEMEDAQEPEPW